MDRSRNETLVYDYLEAAGKPASAAPASQTAGPAPASQGGAPAPESSDVASDFPVWQRWNDYGIGLLLQGDLRAAEEIFTRVTERRAEGLLSIVVVAQGTTRRQGRKLGSTWF